MARDTPNRDRLRGLERREHPDGPQGQARRPSSGPSNTHSPHTAEKVPAFTQHVDTRTKKSRSLLVPAFAVVGALFLTSLVIALAVITGDSIETSPRSDVTPPTSTPIDPDPQGQPRELSAFDRPIDVGGLIQKVTASTVVIVCEPVEEFGSGFAFDLSSIGGPSDRVVVTNHHVIVSCLDSGQVDVYQGDDYYPGEIESWDRNADLAVVSAPGLTASALEPNFEPQVGQWVMAVGAPEGVENSASFGSITGILDNEPTITSDAIIAGGSSGGPLVDNQGRVVAVNYAVWEEATGISLSAPIDALCLTAVNCN